MGERFFEADGPHAQGDAVGVGKFEGFAVEGLGVVFADFGVPVCEGFLVSQGRGKLREGQLWLWEKGMRKRGLYLSC